MVDGDFENRIWAFFFICILPVFSQSMELFLSLYTIACVHMQMPENRFPKYQKYTWFHLPIFNHLNIITLQQAKVRVFALQQFDACVPVHLLSWLSASIWPSIRIETLLASY